MRSKTKSKNEIIEELEDESFRFAQDCIELKIKSLKLESEIEKLRAELEAEREKYTDLLERYIKTMERTARIDEQR